MAAARHRLYAGKRRAGIIPRIETKGESLTDQDPNSPPKNPGEAREEARRKLMGRAMVIGLLSLTALYAMVTYLGRR